MRYEDDEKGLLHRLRSLDHAAKTKVMIAITVVIMIAIVYFWLAYFNNILAGMAVSGGEGAEGKPVSHEPGPWEYIKSGFTGMGKAFGNIFESPREYQIAPGQ